jgi:hypothetical protein
MASNRTHCQAFRVLANPNVCINWTLPSICVYFWLKRTAKLFEIGCFFLNLYFVVNYACIMSNGCWVVYLSYFYTFHIYIYIYIYIWFLHLLTWKYKCTGERELVNLTIKDYLCCFLQPSCEILHCVN